MTNMTANYNLTQLQLFASSLRTQQQYINATLIDLDRQIKQCLLSERNSGNLGSGTGTGGGNSGQFGQIPGVGPITQTGTSSSRTSTQRVRKHRATTRKPAAVAGTAAGGNTAVATPVIAQKRKRPSAAQRRAWAANSQRAREAAARRRQAQQAAMTAGG
jgi:hypothetical protein